MAISVIIRRTVKNETMANQRQVDELLGEKTK